MTFGHRKGRYRLDTEYCVWCWRRDGGGVIPYASLQLRVEGWGIRGGGGGPARPVLMRYLLIAGCLLLGALFSQCGYHHHAGAGKGLAV